MGMSHKDIPDMLGRVLSGTKYGVKQTRGKFGLGAKMALIWSKMSTGLPIEVASARRGAASRSYYKLDLDIQRWAGWRHGGLTHLKLRNKGSLTERCTNEELFSPFSTLSLLLCCVWIFFVISTSSQRAMQRRATRAGSLARLGPAAGPRAWLSSALEGVALSVFVCPPDPAGTSPMCTRASCWTTATAGTAQSSVW